MPQAIAGALYYAFGSAAFGWGAAYTIAYAVVIAGTVAYTSNARRKAEARARDAANASAKDRELMIRSAIAPRRIVYGRDRISGPIVFMESTGDKQQYLHMVVALAAHECDAIETVYFNEVALPDPDVNGFITSGEFAKPGTTESATHTGTTNGSGAITLPHSAVAVLTAFTSVGTGESEVQTHYSPSHTTGSATVTGLPADTSVTIGYTYTTAASALVRVRKYLGTSTQTADADLVAESDGKWTTDHRGRGICYLYVRLEYDQEIFGSTGVPNISALVRGKKVYDPRTATTVWSNNAALCVADYLRSDEGMRATSTEVPDSEVTAAANVCDEEIDLSLDDEDVQARYTCDLSITTDRSPRDALAELLACMSGRAVWTQGRWLVRPGAYRTPTVTITADMLAGPISVVPRASRSELFNAVRATYRDPDQQFAEVQAPLVENSGYEASDGGVQIVRQIDVPTLADTYRAQRLAKIELERARQALTIKLTCNLKAYDLAPTDTALVTLSTYGWTAKPFEVLSRTITREGTIEYTLRETAAEVYDWAWGEATVGDLAPNTNLPNPFGLPAILENLAADEDAIRLADGTIITQAVVTWDASESPFVASGGSIQYQAAKVGTPWGTGSLPGDATSVILGPLQVGVAYVFRARAINAAGRAGDWATIGLVAQGIAAPPDDVTGLDWGIKPGQVWITWTPCDEADYAATELRYDGTGWDDATFLWRGAGSDYQHPRPPNGTYVVRAKHLDTSGNYSTNAASISVTVDDSIDQFGAGLLRLTTDRFPYFQFADGTTHTAQAPGADPIAFTAKLYGLKGTATFAAEAFDADDDSLGAVTLGGSGNVRTMTAAQFVAPGTSGSVRYVDVTATLGAASDTLRVFRADPTITEPRIYLSNPTHAVPTDEAGDNGDYSGASTGVQVFEGITDVTDDWSFAIAPDSGVTAAINGGAGPVTGTASVTVAVSDITIPDGAVLITASKTGESDLTASFLVTKSESIGAYTAYWDPRSEIVLQVDAQGNVAGYADAYSTLRILKGTADDAANWTFSKADTNVTSTISTGGRVDVTALLALGELGATSDTAQTPWPSGWSYASQLIYGGGVWLQIGYGSTTKIRRSTDDMATWQEVDTGLSAGDLRTGGYVGGVFIVTGGPGLYTDRLIRSADGGLTWTEDTLPGAVQAYTLSRVGDELIIGGSTTAGYRTNDGDTWTSHTAPSYGCHFAGVGSAWASIDIAGGLYGSANSGGSWTAINLAAVTGRAGLGPMYVRAFRGRLVAVLYHTSGGPPSMVITSTNGLQWVACAMPSTYTQPDWFDEVSGVLYLVDGTGEVYYSSDGLAWGSSGDNMTADISPPDAYTRYVHIHEPWSGTFLPSLNLTTRSLVRAPLLATSATEGAVTVTATKPGEFDIVRTLIVRKGAVGQDIYTSYAAPAMLLLPATSDGVVTSYDNATITAYVLRNGVDDTSNWSWTYTTTNLTPSSGTGNSVTITAMGNSPNTGSITFRASKAGQPDITGTLAVNKVLGNEPSGPRIGAAFNAISFSHTEIGLRFKSDGRFQVRKGSGGSWVDAGTWAGAVTSGNSSYWLRVEASGHALASGTTGTWLAMTSDRDYVLSDASSGTHTTSLQVMFATDNAGANAVMGFGSLQLIVP